MPIGDILVPTRTIVFNTDWFQEVTFIVLYISPPDMRISKAGFIQYLDQIKNNNKINKNCKCVFCV